MTIDEQLRERFDVLTLDFPPANALNPLSIQSIIQKIEGFKSGNRPLLICSSNEKYFSRGFDLGALIGIERSMMKDFLSLFHTLMREIFLFPRRTICIVNGVASGSGTLLAMACDTLYFQGSEKSSLSLSQWNLGIPIPFSGLKILQMKCPYHFLVRWCRAKKGFMAPKLLDVGLFQHLDFKASLLSTRSQFTHSEDMAMAHDILLLKADIFPEKTSISKEDEFFLDCWYSDKTQKKILTLVDKAIKNRE